MSHKTLAIIDGNNGRKYRVRKWNDHDGTLCAEHGRPGRIDVQNPETGEWNHLNWWSAAAEFGNQSDDEVMEEALKRLDIAFGVEPERIVYDDCSSVYQIEPDGVTVEAM
jgi:hypothetical protein